MKVNSFHILRVGVAVTFLWIGVLIFKSPEAWGGFLQPWAAGLLLIPLKIAMIATAILDISIGIALLAGFLTWPAALLGSFHLIVVLIVSGINAITVRDLGLLAATIALFTSSFPKFKINN
ncbi:MAG: DoxX family membrane protein [Candidatus Nealsonbacteria bacterium]|nr:DoxX family membrane protein [Candidatus Nealsonbacteria bacterium]